MSVFEANQENHLSSIDYLRTLLTKHERITGPMQTLALIMVAKSYDLEVTDLDDPLAKAIRRYTALNDLMQGELTTAITHCAIKAGVVSEQEEAEFLEDLRELVDAGKPMLERLSRDEV